jgi:hypothetical protein
MKYVGTRNSFKVLFGSSSYEVFGRLKMRQKDNIKVDLIQIGNGGLELD